MAEILLRAVDNISGHPLAWKRGMPVVVFENGHPWSPQESLPPANGGKFVVIKVTDVTVAQVEQFLRNRWGIDLCDPEIAVVTVEPTEIRRRVIEIRLADLPIAVRQELNQTGSYTTTWPVLRDFLRKIATDEAF
jgi:hypothetical protein